MNASAPCSGVVIDRLGAHVSYAIGLVAFTLSYALASDATALWQLHLLVGVCAGVAAAD